MNNELGNSCMRVDSEETSKLPSYNRLKTAQRALADVILGETDNPVRAVALETMCEPAWEEILSGVCAIILERRRWNKAGFTERVLEFSGTKQLMIVKTFVRMTNVDDEEYRTVRRELVPQIVEFMRAICACSVETGASDEIQKAIDRTLRNCAVFEQEHANN